MSRSPSSDILILGATGLFLSIRDIEIQCTNNIHRGRIYGPPYNAVPLCTPAALTV